MLEQHLLQTIVHYLTFRLLVLTPVSAWIADLWPPIQIQVERFNNSTIQRFQWMAVELLQIDILYRKQSEIGASINDNCKPIIPSIDNSNNISSAAQPNIICCLLDFIHQHLYSAIINTNLTGYQQIALYQSHSVKQNIEQRPVKHLFVV